MSGLASEVSFILFLLHLPFYGVCIGFICAAIAAVRRRSYLIAALLAGIVAFPLANYCYAYFWAVHEAPQARRADVASWPRLRIAHDNKPRVFVSGLRFEDGFLPSTLVALGRFEKAYGLIGDYWYSFERVPSLSCVEAGKDERAIRTRSRRVTNPCVTLTEAGKQNGKHLDIPEIAEPHLELLADIDAPSHYEDDATRDGGSALELRLVSSEGGKLVSFWEAPRFQIPTFPPFTIGKGGWAKTSYTAEHAPRPNPIQFVLDAMDGV